MSDLLTHEEYIALAKNLNFPDTSFIDGSFRTVKSGKTFPTLNPATGETLAEVSECGSEVVDFAVTKSAGSI